MALSACYTVTDLQQRELQEHGSVSFPIACYYDDLPLQNVPWHWHEEWEFAIVTEGSTEFFLENVRVPLETGEGIFINSLALHAAEACQGVRSRLHSAAFHPRLVGGSADSCFHQELVQPFLKNLSWRYVVLQPSVPWQAQVLECFHNVWQAMAEEPEDCANWVRYQLSQALGIILRHCDLPATQPSRQEQRDAVRIRTMLEFIENRFAQDLTLENIAGSIAVSSSVCLRCFSQMLGVTPMQYVKQLRLGKAAEQLLTTRRSIRSIALDCGFNDVSYFNRAFRERYGQTPGQYRKAAQS